MDAPLQVGEPFLQAVSICLPRHPIHSRRRLPFQVVVAAPEQVEIDMMQQGGEPYLLVPFGCLTYTVQPAWPAFPALSPVRFRLFRVLLGQRPSLCDLLRPSPACVRPLRWYYAAVRLPIVVHGGLRAHRLLPPIRRRAAADDNRVSRFSCVKFPCMRGVYDSAEPAAHSRLVAHHGIAFRFA